MSAANLLPTPERLTPHPQYIGPYRVLGSLGQGILGAIRLGTFGTGASRRLVVLKELRREAVANGQSYQRLLEQAETNVRITHQHVVKTLGLVRHENTQFLVLEFLHGQPFNQIVQTSRLEPKVPLRLRLQVIRDALAGLHHAHELSDQRGAPLALVHGDMSPANVFVTYEGIVKVVNFGLARAARMTPRDIGETSKWRYAPPELLLGEALDRRSDAFSVGVMLWETICLRRFTSRSASDRTTVQRRVSGAEPRIAQVSPSVPPRLAKICDKALSVRREDRFQTALEFHDALVEYMEVSGATIKTPAVGYLLSRKFETERTGVEKRIKRYSDVAEDVRTSVELRRNTFEIDDDEPTMLFTGTVASLPAQRVSAPSAPPKRHSRPLLWVALAVVVFTLGAAFANGRRAASTNENVAGSSVPIGGPAAEPRTLTAAIAEHSPESSAASIASAAALLGAEGTTAPPPASVSPGAEYNAAENTAAGEGPPAPGHLRRKARPHRTARGQASDAVPETTAPTQPVSAAPPTEQRAITASGVGEDLRQLSPPAYLPVDPENPFR